MSRRKSTFQFNRPLWLERDGGGGAESAAQELERLEQETTLVLQEIDHNLSRATAVIDDKMFPILKKYAVSTEHVWKNVGFWKHFMEEAAGVEIKTTNEPSGSQEKSANEAASKDPDSAETAAKISEHASVSPPRQFQASTPLKPSYRDPGSSRGSGSRDRPRYSDSGKNTPLGSQTEAEARRLSLLHKHMNLSPTLPEPPVLMSDFGRFHSNSSSSAVRPAPGIQGSSSSDSDLDLGRLLPILLPSLVISPHGQNAAQNAAPGGSGERNAANPKAQELGSNQRKRAASYSQASPVRRGIPQYTALEQDVSDLQAPTLTTGHKHRMDESEDIAVPDLATLPQKNAGDAKKRKAANDDDINVFLDHADADKNASTVYHTMAHDSEIEEAPSMPQLFENVLSAGPRETSNAAGEAEQGTDAGTGATATAQSENATLPVDILTSNPDVVEPTGPENTSQHGHSFEHTGNSSEMDSFFREKWRALSSTTKKGG